MECMERTPHPAPTPKLRFGVHFRTAAEGRLRHLLPQGRRGIRIGGRTLALQVTSKKLPERDGVHAGREVLPLSVVSSRCIPPRCRNAQQADAAFVSIDSKLHLPLRANAIILAIKAAADPVGVRQHKLPP